MAQHYSQQDIDDLIFCSGEYRLTPEDRKAREQASQQRQGEKRLRQIIRERGNLMTFVGPGGAERVVDLNAFAFE